MRSRIAHGWRSLGRRAVGALRLDGATYREVSLDPDALPQAVAIILLSSLVSAIVFLATGSAPGLSVSVDWASYPVTRESDAAAALAGGVLDGGWGLIIWAVQTSIIWILWNRFAGARRSWRAVAAPLGFANAPLIVFAFFEAAPIVGGVLGAIGLLWMLVASVVAVRAALNTGWGRASVLLAISVVVLLPVSIVISIAG